MDYFQLGSQAISDAANLIRSNQLNTDIISTEENEKEVKLKADQLLNDIIIRQLSLAKLPILSEEENAGINLNNVEGWIIDPLDGSLNFSRGIPLCAVSIALVKKGKTSSAFIYDFLKDSITTCTNNSKLYINSKPIRVSNNTELKSSIICTGFPSRLEFTQNNLTDYIKFATEFRKVRMFGSAVQSLLHLAKGMVDAYYEKDIMIWDIAAGKLLVEQAGGVCSEFQGRLPNSRIFVASTPKIHLQILKLLNLDKKNCL